MPSHYLAVLKIFWSLMIVSCFMYVNTEHWLLIATSIVSVSEKLLWLTELIDYHPPNCQIQITFRSHIEKES